MGTWLDGLSGTRAACHAHTASRVPSRSPSLCPSGRPALRGRWLGSPARAAGLAFPFCSLSPLERRRRAALQCPRRGTSSLLAVSASNAPGPAGTCLFPSIARSVHPLSAAAIPGRQLLPSCHLPIGGFRSEFGNGDVSHLLSPRRLICKHECHLEPSEPFGLGSGLFPTPSPGLRQRHCFSLKNVLPCFVQSVRIRSIVASAFLVGLEGRKQLLTSLVGFYF